MRSLLFILGLVIVVGLIGAASDGSVAWPGQSSDQVAQLASELCPPGTVYHCEEVCVWWYQDTDPRCVNLCELLLWWCYPCLQLCIRGCPTVWMCLQTRVVCSCVSDIPYGIEPIAY